MSHETETLSTVNAEMHSSCFESAERQQATMPEAGNAAWQACENDSMKQAMSDMKIERTDATIIALVPVPFAWGLVYLVIFLVRWVKRGFGGAK